LKDYHLIISGQFVASVLRVVCFCGMGALFLGLGLFCGPMLDGGEAGLLALG